VEMVVTYLMACYHSPEETEETHEKPKIAVSLTDILNTCFPNASLSFHRRGRYL
jgi:hypothetical protein